MNPSLLIPLIVVAVVVLLPVVYVVAQYNALVALKNYIRESWSNVDTELKRRYDLIPNLVAVVKGYAAHERAVLERVTELRNRCAANNGSPAEQSVDEKQLVDSLKQLLVVVENYPQLKADQNFLNSRPNWSTPRTASRPRAGFTTATSAITATNAKPFRATWWRTCSASNPKAIFSACRRRSGSAERGF